jgi:hypothetical protein
MTLKVMLKYGDRSPEFVEVSSEWDAPTVLMYKDRYFLRESYVLNCWKYTEVSFDVLEE